MQFQITLRSDHVAGYSIGTRQLRSRDDKRTYDLGAGRVEDITRATSGVERDEEQRSTVIDAVVTDANEITTNDWNGALDCVEIDEVRFACHCVLQRYIRALRHLG